jgi:hypothetical protein
MAPTSSSGRRSYVGLDPQSNCCPLVTLGASMETVDTDLLNMDESEQRRARLSRPHRPNCAAVCCAPSGGKSVRRSGSRTSVAR